VTISAATKATTAYAEAQATTHGYWEDRGRHHSRWCGQRRDFRPVSQSLQAYAPSPVLIDSVTPTTTPTCSETNQMQLHATARKICRTSFTYGEFSLRPCAMTQVQKQTLPLSHGGGHEFESRRVHPKTHRFAAQNYRTQRSLSRDPGLLTATEDRVRRCAKQAASGYCWYALARITIPNNIL
jgi:hypothetical protein